MSNRNPDTASGTLHQLLQFAMEQRLKLVHTAIPGEVHRYDAATGRAQVQPLLDLMLTDGRRVAPPVLPDIPILQPAVAGYDIHLPISAGDTVWVMISERGIDEFKETLRRSAPDPEGLLSLKDAVAIPVRFARRGPPPTDGLVLSTAAGADYISIRPGNIEVRGSGTMTITMPQDTVVIR